MRKSFFYSVTNICEEFHHQLVMTNEVSNQASNIVVRFEPFLPNFKIHRIKKSPKVNEQD